MAAIVLEVKALDALKAEMEKEIMDLAGEVEQSEGNLLAEKKAVTGVK